MGCAVSRIDKEERVQICKERKKLMKQLLVFRGDFANGLLAYMRALKNTGVALRQFTDYESLELEIMPFSLGLPSLPQRLLPLPPSPPPPPQYSPESNIFERNLGKGSAQEEIIEIDEDSFRTPPPPPSIKNTWGDPFDSSSPVHEKHIGEREEVDEENWAETKSEFDDDDQDEKKIADQSHKAIDVIPMKVQNVDVDDDSSTISAQTKETGNAAMVVWRNKTSLPGIIEELDDYFLKASAGGKEIAVLIDVERMNNQLHNVNGDKRKGNNSAKVFSSLSWSWSSRSQQLNRDVVELGIPDEPCRPGAHCVALEKLYAEEQKIYKAVRDEAIAKMEYERKTLFLRKQQEENADWNKIQKIHLAIERLGSGIGRLQQLISETRSAILTLIEEQLHPQLVALLSGLLQMWKTMHECHQVQSQISQKVGHISSNRRSDPTTDYHREATLQLEAEVSFWYKSFCGLTKAQREYVGALSKWIRLTAYLVDDEKPNLSVSAIQKVCERWQLVLDRLPEKVTSEAVKRFLSVIHDIITQQEEEFNLKRKYEKVEKRLRKELNSLIELEEKLKESMISGDGESTLSPKHSITIKPAKADALKKRYENEKAKYLNAVQATRAMTLNHLKSSLPSTFKALIGYSGSCAQALETVISFSQTVYQPPIAPT